MDNDKYIYEAAIRDAAIASDKKMVYPEAINQMVNDEYIRDVAIAFDKEAVYLEAINQMINDEYIRDVAIASNKETVCHSAISQMVNDEYLYEVKQKLNSLIAERERKLREEKEKIERERKEAVRREAENRKEAERKEAEQERAKAFASYEKKSPQLTMRREDPCDRCMCKYGAQATIFGLDKINFSCPHKQFTRTKVADYYWCHKGGPPNDGYPHGWHSGSGY